MTQEITEEPRQIGRDNIWRNFVTLWREDMLSEDLPESGEYLLWISKEVFWLPSTVVWWEKCYQVASSSDEYVRGVAEGVYLGRRKSVSERSTGFSVTETFGTCAVIRVEGGSMVSCRLVEALSDFPCKLVD